VAVVAACHHCDTLLRAPLLGRHWSLIIQVCINAVNQQPCIKIVRCKFCMALCCMCGYVAAYAGSSRHCTLRSNRPGLCIQHHSHMVPHQFDAGTTISQHAYTGLTQSCSKLMNSFCAHICYGKFLSEACCPHLQEACGCAVQSALY
jgi:hypothetical protein